MANRTLVILVSCITLAACATAPQSPEPATASGPATVDYGHLWIQNSAEYQALSLQVYQAATAASRQQMVNDHQRFWGRGWYVLPNPMHGSWTSAE